MICHEIFQFYYNTGADGNSVYFQVPLPAYLRKAYNRRLFFIFACSYRLSERKKIFHLENFMTK